MLARRRIDLATLALSIAAILGVANLASASILGALEEDSWSDMAFGGGVIGGFNSGTGLLTVSASPSNDLEIGGEFGPSNPGRHYGTGGTLGGPFMAALSVSGVVIQPSGIVTTGGSVLITYNGSASGSIGDDYGIVAGAALLTGTVLQVKLDATGDNTLDVLFSISGGALQNNNPSLGTNFSPDNVGLLRFAGSAITLPSDWSGDFSLNGATLDVLGAAVPEPRFATFAVFSLILAWMGGSRSCCRLNE
jgi:hypothetical protein